MTQLLFRWHLRSSQFLPVQKRFLRYNTLLASHWGRAKAHNATEKERYIGAETVRRQYGLSNQMFFYASMMSYAHMDRRDVVFPLDAEIPFYDLFDVAATQAAIAQDDVYIANASETVGFRSVRYKRIIPLPERKHCTGDDAGKTTAWSFIDLLFNHSRRTPYVVQGDFYLRWPFDVAHTGHRDLCYWMARMQFPRFIDTVARRMLSEMSGRVLSVHLRLEPDAGLLAASSQRVTAGELRHHFLTRVLPLARALAITCIYICSGTIRADLVDTLRTLNTSIPVRMKSDFAASYTLPVKIGKYGGYSTTNHYGAVLDLLMMQYSTAVIVSAYSTLAVNVLSRRCGSHGPSGVFLHSLRRDYHYTNIAYAPCDRPLLMHCYHGGANRIPQLLDASDLK